MTVDTDTLSNEDLEVTMTNDGYVLRANLDRPDKSNAVNENVVEGLLGVMDAVDGSGVRVVVVRGNGGTFSSGGDLGDIDERGEQTALERREDEAGLSELYDAMHSMDALTVAAVEGYCLAGGCGIASACEFIVAEDEATFGTPEANVGMFPMQAMASIMRTVPEKRGLKMLFTGEFVSAQEAHEMGLVTDIYDVDAFDEELEAFVDTLASNSPVMISLGKEAYYAQREMDFDRAHSYLHEMLVLLMMSEDHEEGIQAFLEDREPQWKGK